MPRIYMYCNGHNVHGKERRGETWCNRLKRERRNRSYRTYLYTKIWIRVATKDDWIKTRPLKILWNCLTKKRDGLRIYMFSRYERTVAWEIGERLKRCLKSLLDILSLKKTVQKFIKQGKNIKKWRIKNKLIRYSTTIYLIINLPILCSTKTDTISSIILRCKFYTGNCSSSIITMIIHRILNWKLKTYMQYYTNSIYFLVPSPQALMMIRL